MITREKLLQLCFDEEDFKQENFDEAKFLVDKRKHVSIESLQKDLRLYSEHLREEVVQLINTDLYDNFLSVSNKLNGIDTDLSRIVEPLPEITSRVDRSAKKLQDCRNTVQQKLQDCATIDANRRYYVQVLKLSFMEERITDWLESTAEAEQVDFQSLRRVAIECKQLERDEAFCQPSNPDQEDEKQALTERTVQCRTRYCNILDERFLEIIQRQQELLAEAEQCPEALKKLDEEARVCLECYHTLEIESMATNLFTENVVRGIVDKVLSWSVAGNQRNASAEALGPLLEDLMDTIERQCVPMLTLVQGVSPDFRLVQSMWKCIMEIILKRMQNIFSPGIQSKFHTHYKAAHALLERFEAHISTHAELEAFRKSEEMEVWNSKWLLSVYLALRQKEVMADLTNNLKERLVRQDPDVAASSGFNFSQVCMIHRLVFWLFGDSVFLFPLGDQLLKMVVRTLIVFQKWTEKWAQPPEVTERSAPASPLVEGNGRIPIDGDGDFAANGKAGEGHTPVPPEKPGLTMASMNLEDFIALYHDVEFLVEDLKESFCDTVLRRMHLEGSDGPSVMSIAELCDYCAQLAGSSLLVIKSRIVGMVTKQCVDKMVTPLKSITSLYRMTKKPIPTRHSFFIPELISPVQAFREVCKRGAADASSLTQLPSYLVEECVKDILVGLTNVYYEEAKQLLITAKKAEKAVSTLRKKPTKEVDEKGDGKDAKDVSDTDKIYVQIYLDIQEFGKQFQTHLNVSKDFPAYSRLLELVQRARWLLGEISEEPADAL